MGNTLLVYVMVKAIDNASAILAKIGTGGLAALNPLTVAMVAVGSGLAAITVESLKAANAFDYQMQKIRALTGTTDDELKAYKDQLLALAPQLDQAPTDLAKGLYFVISAGFKGAAAIDVLKYSAQAAAATMGDMGHIADMVTSALNAYKGEGYTAGQVTDDLVTAMVQGKANMHAFQTSFAFLAVTARAGGFSIGEAAAAMSALSRVSGDTASRRMTMGLDNLIRSLGNLQHIEKTMKAHHLGFNEKAYAAKNLGDKILYIAQVSGLSTKTLADLKKEAGGNQAKFEDLALTLIKNNQLFKDLAGGAAAFIPASILAGDGGKAFNDILAKMNGHGEKTIAAFNIMRQSSQQQMRMIEITFQSMATMLGEKMEPVFKTVLGGLYTVFHDWLLGFMSMKGGMDAVMKALMGIGAVVAAYLIPLFISLAVASIGVWGPIVLAIGGVIAAGILLSKIWDAVLDHFHGWNGLLKALHPLLSTIQLALKNAGNELHKAFANPQVQAALKQLQASLPALIPLFKVIGAIVLAVVVVGFHILVGVLTGLAGALPGIIEWFTGLTNLLGGFGRLLIDVFTGNGADATDAWNQMVKGMGQMLHGEISSILGFLHGFIEHFVTLFGGSDKKIGDSLKQTGANIKNTVGGWFNGLGTAIHNGITGIGDWFNRLGTNIHVHLIAAQMLIVTTVGGWFSALGTTVHNGVNAVVDFFQKLPGRVIANLTQQGQFILAAIEWPFKQLARFGHYLYDHSGRIKNWVDTITAIVTTLRDRFVARINAIRERVTAIWDRIADDARLAMRLFEVRVIAPIERLVAMVYFRWMLLRLRIQVEMFLIHLHIEQAWARVVATTRRLLALVHRYIVEPFQKGWAEVQRLVGQLVAWVGGRFSALGDTAHKVWDRIVSDIISLKDRLGTAVHDHIVKPIQDKWAGLVKDAQNWGSNLMQMIAKGIDGAKHYVSDAAHRALNGIKDWLAWHSPAPKVPDSAYWGSNLIKMLGASMLSEQSGLSLAARRLSQSIGKELTNPANASIGVAANGAASGLAGVARAAGALGSGERGNVTHTYNVTFPGVKNKDEIKKALEELQQDDYRKGKRAGGYGGLRAGIDTLT